MPSDTQYWCLIAIPLRNEEPNVGELAKRLEHSLSDTGKAVMVVFVNDGSTDGTRQALNQSLASWSPHRYRVIETPGIGQAAAIDAAFRLLPSTYVMRMDGDLQDHPEDISLFFTKLDNGHDLVVGLRSMRQASRFQRLTSSVFDALAILLLGSPFHSSVASMVAMRKCLISSHCLRGRDNRYMVMLAFLSGSTSPTEVLVTHGVRTAGSSKYRKSWKFTVGTFQGVFFLMKAALRTNFGRQTW